MQRQGRHRGVRSPMTKLPKGRKQRSSNPTRRCQIGEMRGTRARMLFSTHLQITELPNKPYGASPAAQKVNEWLPTLRFADENPDECSTTSYGARLESERGPTNEGRSVNRRAV